MYWKRYNNVHALARLCAIVIAGAVESNPAEQPAAECSEPPHAEDKAMGKTVVYCDSKVCVLCGWEGGGGGRDVLLNNTMSSDRVQ